MAPAAGVAGSSSVRSASPHRLSDGLLSGRSVECIQLVRDGTHSPSGPWSGLSACPFQEIDEFRHHVSCGEHDADLLDLAAPERQPAQADEAAEFQDNENQLDQGGQLENQQHDVPPEALHPMCFPGGLCKEGHLYKAISLGLATRIFAVSH